MLTPLISEDTLQHSKSLISILTCTVRELHSSTTWEIFNFPFSSLKFNNCTLNVIADPMRTVTLSILPNGCSLPFFEHKSLYFYLSSRFSHSYSTYVSHKKDTSFPEIGARPPHCQRNTEVCTAIWKYVILISRIH